MTKPTTTEWLDGVLSCEDGTSGEFFYYMTKIRDKLIAAKKMREALVVLLREADEIAITAPVYFDSYGEAAEQAGLALEDWEATE